MVQPEDLEFTRMEELLTSEPRLSLLAGTRGAEEDISTAEAVPDRAAIAKKPSTRARIQHHGPAPGSRKIGWKDGDRQL